MKQIKRIFMAIVLICACNTHNCFAVQIINSCAATEPPCDTGCHEDPDTGFCVSDQLTPGGQDDPCWDYTSTMSCLDSAETCYWNDIGGGNHVCSSTQIESCHDIDAFSVQSPRTTCNNATVGGQQCEWTTSLSGLCRNKTTTVTCCDGTTASSVSACPTCSTCAAITNTSMCTTYNTTTLNCSLSGGSCRDKTCADLSQSNCTTYNTNWHCMWDSMQGCRACNEYEYYDTTNKTCKQCASADDPRNVTDYARYTDGNHHYWSYRFAETNATSRQQCYAKYPSGPVSSVTIANSSNCSNASTTGKMFYQTANACRVTEATCQNGYYFNPTNGANTCSPCTNNANGNGIFTGPGNKNGEDPIGTTISTLCPIKCPINKTGPAYYETSAKTCETCKNAGTNGRPNGYADAEWLVTDTNQASGGYCAWRIICQKNYEWKNLDYIGNCYACPAHYHTDQAYIVYAYQNATDGHLSVPYY